MEYQEVTKQEVWDVLFTAAPMNAPGITGMTGKAYQWTWTVLEDEMYHLIHLCARMGYHPRECRTSIAVALQKPKRDYSLPRSYRLIQLLEVLGKVLEWVQAWRLAYITAKHDLFPPSQFSSIPGRLAEDALICTVHDIETAWNHKCKASILTFDITGFFDTIPLTPPQHTPFIPHPTTHCMLGTLIPPRLAHLHMPWWQERQAMANRDWCTTRFMRLTNSGSIFHLTNGWRSSLCGNIMDQGMHRAKHSCQRWQGYPLTDYTVCRRWGNPSLRTHPRCHSEDNHHSVQRNS